MYEHIRAGSSGNVSLGAAIRLCILHPFRAKGTREKKIRDRGQNDKTPHSEAKIGTF